VWEAAASEGPASPTLQHASPASLGPASLGPASLGPASLGPCSARAACSLGQGSTCSVGLQPATPPCVLHPLTCFTPLRASPPCALHPLGEGRDRGEMRTLLASLLTAVEAVERGEAPDAARLDLDGEIDCEIVVRSITCFLPTHPPTHPLTHSLTHYYYYCRCRPRRPRLTCLGSHT
jgi:hypothetical protein